MHGDENFNSDPRPNLSSGGRIRPHSQSSNGGHFSGIASDLHSTAGLSWHSPDIRDSKTTTVGRFLQWAIVSVSFCGLLWVGVVAGIGVFGG